MLRFGGFHTYQVAKKISTNSHTRLVIGTLGKGPLIFGSLNLGIKVQGEVSTCKSR